MLTDTDAYPEWNPFVRSLRGALVVGERIEAERAAPGAAPRTIRPRVSADEGWSFEWLGRIGPRHVFDGGRFEVRPDGPDGCVLVQHEHLGPPGAGGPLDAHRCHAGGIRRPPRR